ncbi:SMI1/KNR4 family protein [Lysobacter sp. Root690]|uniref:SMI1/KNR4 family protein n=1 Tax=Lysobacter sp. Root690 TaxID=1736588 RepID=UPI0006F4BEAF|nr:SMI1/KNR4 family protein [Lysobacter sp. Root690]KRB02384.1 hypothetical protein ASD86_22810 [Lysobacter sp. Root690]
MTYESLAARAGIPLPSTFARLLADGRTRYGDNLADWKANWSDYTLRAQPLLSCAYDLEWIDAEQAGEIVDDWLNPGFQNGRAFLPFAISGAGDAYCLMTTAAGTSGVGMVWHDRDDSAIETASFEHFVFTSLVESAADFEHLLDDFSSAQARECVLANMRAAAAYLPANLNHALDALISPQLPEDESDIAMISQATAEAAFGVLLPFAQERFAVVPRWQCNEG